MISEGELDLSTTKESLVLGPDGKTRKTKLYNLEMVISVGYRVKSRNGIIFRRWANEILKDFLIKGYMIDSNRTVITKENYLNLCEEVNSLKHEVKDLRKQIEIFNPNEKVLVEHQIYTAFVYINALLRSAEKKIIIIDGYLNDSSLEFFVNVNRNTDITLITHKTNRFTQRTIKRFKDEFINTTIIENKSFHDRFLIIDETVYSLGTSLNNLGKKLTTITLLDNTNANDLVKCVLK
ncbi:MAG: virulence RhuM family protein [Bacilli bacterium]|nr:virulence RhuM family protein [Bacilli bacterium]